MDDRSHRALLAPLVALGVLCFAACGDDAADDRDEGGRGHIVDRPDAQLPPPVTSPASDAGLVYSFPCAGERGPPTYEATFTSVYLDIFCEAKCANFYCHGSRGAWGGLDLASSIEWAYSNLISRRTGTSVPADGRDTCRDSELLRVVPGSPEQSLLYLKVTDAAPCGSYMPPAGSGFPRLKPEQIDHIRRWIEAGAPLDHRGEDAGAADAEDAGAADASDMSAAAQP